MCHIYRSYWLHNDIFILLIRHISWLLVMYTLFTMVYACCVYFCGTLWWCFALPVYIYNVYVLITVSPGILKCMGDFTCIKCHTGMVKSTILRQQVNVPANNIKKNELRHRGHEVVQMSIQHMSTLFSVSKTQLPLMRRGFKLVFIFSIMSFSVCTACL